MKSIQFFRVAIMTAAIAFASSAFAGGPAHKGSISLSDPVQVNGKQVPAGDYKVTWDGDGPNVNLHILRDNKEIAASPATVKPLESKASDNSAETRRAGAGAPELTTIRFAGKNFELQLGSTTGRADMRDGDTVK